MEMSKEASSSHDLALNRFGSIITKREESEVVAAAEERLQGTAYLFGSEPRKCHKKA
jgi:hypothetical protein